MVEGLGLCKVLWRSSAFSPIGAVDRGKAEEGLPEKTSVFGVRLSGQRREDARTRATPKTGAQDLCLGSHKDHVNVPTAVEGLRPGGGRGQGENVELHPNPIRLPAVELKGWCTR